MRSWEEKAFVKKVCCNKHDLVSACDYKFATLQTKIQRALKSRKLLKLKNGLYVRAIDYLDEQDRVKFTEFLASKIRFPSYS